MALQFRVGNFAVQIDREISHATFRVLHEFLAHQRYTLWTLAGGGYHTKSRGLREISHSEFDLARNPPPPLYIAPRTIKVRTPQILVRGLRLGLQANLCPTCSLSCPGLTPKTSSNGQRSFPQFLPLTRQSNAGLETKRRGAPPPPSGAPSLRPAASP